jgi:hypothetical protein
VEEVKGEFGGRLEEREWQGEWEAVWVEIGLAVVVTVVGRAALFVVRGLLWVPLVLFALVED